MLKRCVAESSQRGSVATLGAQAPKLVAGGSGHWIAAGPNLHLPCLIAKRRKNHKMGPVIGGGVQVADFTRGFYIGKNTKWALSYGGE